MVRFIIILLLVALRIIGIPDFLSTGTCWWERALTYSFFHESWWHLSVNCLAVWTIYNPKRGCKPCRDLLFPLLIAVAVYPPLSLRPVIGFSNVLYAVLGIRTPSLSSNWWKRPEVIVFLVVTVGLLFVPRFSATTHIAAFVIGMGLSAVRRFYNEIISDARRYL